MIKRYNIWLLGVLLLIGASAAQALSLGRVRGAVLLGRGLDLNVQTLLDTQESLPESNCLAAEIFYGDTRVSPNSVSLSALRSASGEAQIRVRSSVAVDEPVVTVYLRSTCGASVSRRYVLLADTLTEAETQMVSPPRAEPAPLIPRVATAPGLPARLPQQALAVNRLVHPARHLTWAPPSRQPRSAKRVGKSVCASNASVRKT
ncbi:MAG: hypothetical protein HC858_05185 [Brachymonas sp.]|nr:hypothetical protein [Brachymonas sp.]